MVITKLWRGRGTGVTAAEWSLENRAKLLMLCEEGPLDEVLNDAPEFKNASAALLTLIDDCALMKELWEPSIIGLVQAKVRASIEERIELFMKRDIIVTPLIVEEEKTAILAYVAEVGGSHLLQKNRLVNISYGPATLIDVRVDSTTTEISLRLRGALTNFAVNRDL
eukprot:7576082-Lingulodinium_polyedra.AAC.1